MSATPTTTTEEVHEQTISFGRQQLLLTPEKAVATTAHIFGCGTVGSNAAVELARMGLGRLHLYDFDVVEAHNLPSQRFFKAQLGQKKVTAVAAQLKAIAHDELVIEGHDEKVDKPLAVDGIVVCAVDTMSSRKHIFEKIGMVSTDCPLFIDARMSGNTLQLFAVDPRSKEQCESYAHTLFDDKDADPAPCGGRTVSYTGAISGGLIASYIRAQIMGEKVPFMWAFDLAVFDAVGGGAVA